MSTVLLFEARIAIDSDDIAKAHDTVTHPATRDQLYTQAVQNIIGATGAVVTCVFEED